MSQPPSSPDSSSPDPIRTWLTTPQRPAPFAGPPSSSTSPPPSAPPLPATSTEPATSPPQGRPTPSSVTEVVQSIKPSDLLTVYQSPCSQDGFLTGIGVAAVVGMGRWVMGLAPSKAAHWAVGTGVIGAMAQYEYCQYKRRLEREKMLRMVEVYSARQSREKAEAEHKRAREQREREAKEQEEAARRKSSWRFW